MYSILKSIVTYHLLPTIRADGTVPPRPLILVDKLTLYQSWGGRLYPFLLSICTGILGIFDVLQFEISSLNFFPSLNWEKIPVWNIKLAKSKIPVRVVKNGISKWTKMEFPRFPFLWFTAVGVVNPPDQNLVMYISVNCKKRINS